MRFDRIACSAKANAMRNLIRALLVVAMLVAPFTMCAEGVQGGERECVKNDPDLVQVSDALTVLMEDEVMGVVSVNRHRSDGGLYLVNAPDQARLLRINESWWLYEFEAAFTSNIDDDPAHEILVLATYATGIGPTGAQPFRHNFVLDLQDGVWKTLALSEAQRALTVNELKMAFRPVEPAIFTTAKTKVGEKRQGNEARCQDELARLERSLGRSFDGEVDFARQRLAATSVFLSSGSARIVDIRVRRSDDAYIVYYKTRYPPIGTTDIKVSVLYAILPKDHRSVFFMDRTRSSAPEGEPFKAKTGVR